MMGGFSLRFWWWLWLHAPDFLCVSVYGGLGLVFRLVFPLIFKIVLLWF